MNTLPKWCWVPTIPDLVDSGHLAPSRTLRIPSGLVLEDLKRDKNGEFRTSEVGKRVTGAVVASAVDAYMRYAMGRRAIFFGIHRDHSRRVCEGLRANGIRAAHVDGTDSNAQARPSYERLENRRVGRGGELRPN